MKFKDHFVLAARVVGLIAVFNGASFLLDFVFILLSGNADSFILAYFLAVALFYLISGFYLLRGAPAIVKIAFREKPGDSVFETDD
jgi:hypothetical protein